VSGRVARRQAGRAQEQAPAEAPPAYEEPAPPPPPAPATMGPEMVEQLTQLAALKDQGILTEEEFAAQKAKILGE
jgi:Short C-terminal domain